MNQGLNSSELTPLCMDVRANFIEVRCWPVKDCDAVVSISIRDAENGMAIAAWLSDDDAQKLVVALRAALGETK